MEKMHLEVLRKLHEALLVGHDPQFKIEDLDHVLNPIRIAIASILEVCDQSTRDWVTSNYARELNKQ